MVPKPNPYRIDRMDEACANCGRRYGSHYGEGATALCDLPEKWIGNEPIDYNGTNFKGTKIYMDKLGRIYHTDTPEPNSAFLNRR